MKRVIFNLLFAAGLCALVACAGDGADTKSSDTEVGVAASLRHPPAGSLKGTRGLHGGFAWRGIPYAKAPVGEQRFRAPTPRKAWKGIRSATQFGPSCPQFASPTGGDTSVPEGELGGNEDCLLLNVYAPEGAKSKNTKGDGGLPVMFWIHGGGNTTGTSSFYNGSRLASEHNVIVVSVNYRLGMLGWFRHKSLREGAGPLDASGNFGTLDLIAGLDWVQENIDAFGGDAQNVTIFGESAGGWNVVSLLASPLASGKFHRAIVQSGLTWSFSNERAENYHDDEVPGEEFSSGEALINLMLADGQASDREGAKKQVAAMDNRAIAQYLREKSVAELFAVYAIRKEGEYTCPRLFEDGIVLPAGPLAHAFRPGAPFNRVPVMLGTNKDEEKLFLLFNEEYTTEIFGFIPRLRDRDRYLRDADTITRIWRMMAVDEIAKDLAKSMPGEVFAYRFDWDEEPNVLWFDIGEIIGAAHGFEIPFVFGHWNLGPDTGRLFDDSNLEGREVLSSAMRSYWSEFARSGHPGKGNGQDLATWAAWTEGAQRFVVLDTVAGGGIRMAEGSESPTDIAQVILADTSYATLRRRCRALAAIYDWAPLAFSASDYATTGRGVCRDFPLQEILETF